MEKSQTGWKRVLLFCAVVLLLFIIQKTFNITGGVIADLFSYEKIDPEDAYFGNIVHHITMLVLALIVIVILKIIIKLDFGFRLGDYKLGIKYVVIYTAVFAGIAVVVHLMMLFNNSLPVYAYSLNKNNIIGSLIFQLFLTGPAEETLFRALPITVFVLILGRKIYVKWGITLEIIVAAILFSIAHAKWTLSPFTFEADYTQLVYAFIQGIIAGKAYEDTKSVIYPMLMHSVSNLLMVGTGYLFILLS